MLMFTFHITILLAVAVVAAGLAALHYAATQKAKLLKLAGILLIIIGAASFACTVYYAVQYSRQGQFEQATSCCCKGMMSDMKMDMSGKDGKMQCPMCAKMKAGKAGNEPSISAPAEKAAPDEHKQHH